MLSHKCYPQVLADYDSRTLDLSDPKVYRDLSKPIGCQVKSQEEQFTVRYETWADDELKPFHYGSHYSTAGSVLWYLLRLAPYTNSALQLQGGHLDCPDRLFRSIAEAFHGCTHSTTDVKELIPEFFYLPDFLENKNGLDMGVTQHGQQVGCVELPPWARDAAEFVAINRRALESEHVSSLLHLWIDLIFGHKQRGQAAVEATNVYYYLTYEGEVDLEAIDDEVLRRATEAQIANFGQTPRQLFSTPHPQRLPASACVRPLFSGSLLPAYVGIGASEGYAPTPPTMADAVRGEEEKGWRQDAAGHPVRDMEEAESPARSTVEGGGKWEISAVEANQHDADNGSLRLEAHHSQPAGEENSKDTTPGALEAPTCGEQRAGDIPRKQGSDSASSLRPTPPETPSRRKDKPVPLHTVVSLGSALPLHAQENGEEQRPPPQVEEEMDDIGEGVAGPLFGSTSHLFGSTSQALASPLSSPCSRRGSRSPSPGSPLSHAREHGTVDFECSVLVDAFEDVPEKGRYKHTHTHMHARTRAHTHM
jgi:hypothetical protein